MSSPSVAVVYLARGFDADHADRFRAFAESYRAHPAGCAHRFHVAFKGFADPATRTAAEAAFADIPFEALDTDDLRYDIGAYADVLPALREDVVCFLNTNSEIASPHWLAKLVRNLDTPGVGMVSATGSYESLNFINPTFPKFPNPHLRSNAFAMRRRHAEEILGSYAITGKLDTFQIESGADGLTQRVFALGLTCLIVGGDGRGYAPQAWPASETFRQGGQANLLVHDNQTRTYAEMDAVARRMMTARTWGVSFPATALGSTSWLYLRAERKATDEEVAKVAATNSAADARDQAVRADAQRDAADRAAARLAFGRGVTLCEQGRVDQGLLQFIDALVPAERTGDADLARVIRINFRNWADTLLPAGRAHAYDARSECLCAAYSRDGKHLALGGRDGRVLVLDAATLAVVSELRPARDVFMAGLLGGLLDVSYRLWDDPAGWPGRTTAAFDRLVNQFGDRAVHAVAFDPSGGRVVAGAADGSVTDWDWRTRTARRGCRPRPLKYTDRDVLAVDAAPDGTVWFGDMDGRLRHWDPAAGKLLGEHAAGGAADPPGLGRAAVTAVLVGDDGKTVTTGDRRGQVIARDARSGKVTGFWQLSGAVADLTPAPESPAPGLIALTAAGLATELLAPRAGVTRPGGTRPYLGLALASGQSLAMAPDSRILVVGDGDGNVTLFDTFLGRPMAGPLRVGGTIHRVRFRPGSPREFVVQSGDGVRVQALPWPPAVPLPLPEDKFPVAALASRSAGSGDALAAAGPVVGVFRAGDGAQVGGFRLRGETRCAAFHPSRNVVLRGRTGGWGAYDLDAKRPIAEHEYPGYVMVRSIGVRPGGSGEVFVNKGKSVAVYGADCLGPPLREFPLAGLLRPGTEALAVLFPPDGGRAVVVHGDRVDFLDPVTGAPVGTTLEMPGRNPILCAALTADGTRLVTGHPDTTAQVWDLATGRAVFARPLDHAGAVTGVAVRPDGAVVLTGCRDGTMQAWDVAARLPLGPKRRHEHPVTAVAWGASPKTILTGSDKGAALAWSLETEPATGTVAELRAKYGRLTNNSLDGAAGHPE